MATKRVAPTSWTVDISKTGDRCVVSQGHLPVIGDDEVIVHNSTGGPMTAFFPEGGLFYELNGKPQTFDIADGKQRKFKVKGDKRKKTNVYPYAVFCAVNEDFAIASSNPEIIIDW